MSKYLIRFTKKAEKNFIGLDSTIRSRIQFAIRKLEIDRAPQQFKPLMGKHIAQYRLRVGDWRVLYNVYDDDRVVLILRIGHRRDIYR